MLPKSNVGSHSHATDAESDPLQARLIISDRDREDLDRVFTLHAPQLVKQFRYLIPSQHELDDIVSEAFARAITAWPRFSDRGDPNAVRAWLSTIVRNGCMDYLRSAKNRPLSLDEPLQGSRTDEDSTVTRGEMVSGGRIGDDHYFARREIQQQFDRCLKTLLRSSEVHPAVKAAMLLDCSEEFTVAEIEAKTDLSPKQVREYLDGAERQTAEARVTHRAEWQRQFRNQLMEANPGDWSPLEVVREQMDNAWDSVIEALLQNAYKGLSQAMRPRSILIFNDCFPCGNRDTEPQRQHIGRDHGVNAAAVTRALKEFSPLFFKTFCDHHIDLLIAIRAEWVADSDLELYSLRARFLLASDGATLPDGKPIPKFAFLRP